MNLQGVKITGAPLSIQNVVDVARNHTKIELDSAASKKIEASRKRLETALSRNQTYYGINTGFGSLVTKKISKEDLRALQLNLLRSHASGAGKAFRKEIVRALLLCLIGSLSRGLSGVQMKTVSHLVALLNNDMTPVVPSLGSVGASGDLAPLAHACLPIIGEGLVELPSGEIVSGKEALRTIGLKPLTLEEKEGLALINGTHLMAGSGALLCHDYLQLLRATICAAALSIDALQASHSFLDPRINDARVFGGGKFVTSQLRNLLLGSEIQSERAKLDVKVQDPYSVRCVGPVLGASYEAFTYVERCISTELGAVTDNPLIFDNHDNTDIEIISAGNFHGMPVALPLDTLSIAITHLAGISERRTNLILMNKAHPMLAKNPGVESGMMIPHYTQAACCNELQQLAHPSSVHNVPTCAGVEDYNSWGPRSAAKAERAIEISQTVIAIELLAAAESLEYQRPLRSGEGVEKVHSIVREYVSPLSGDRTLTPDIEALTKAIQDGAFDTILSDFSSHDDV